MGNGINSSQSAVVTDTLTGNNAIDSLLALTHWATMGTNRTIYYSFPNLGSWSSDYTTRNEYRNMTALNAAQQTQFRLALATWSQVANINFVELAESSSQAGDIRVAMNNDIVPERSSGFGYYPSDYASGGDIWLAPNLGEAAVGSFYFATMIHEIGHALGLKHPGNYDSGDSAPSGPFLPSATDNYAYSIMSYNRNDQMLSGSYLTGPSLYDIQAIQLMYGANTGVAPGNDSYTLGTNFQTVWDTNGSNTLDGSAQTSNLSIDLRAGNFSFIGSTLSAALAYGTRMQTARGGSGDNTVYTNDLGDTVDGGAGSDTVVFSNNYSSYAVTPSGNSLVLTRGGASWTVSNVETLRFADTSVAASTLSFNGLRYLASNPDLARAFGTDTNAAYNHYRAYGQAEGRSQTSFDPYRYIASNADLISAFGTNTDAAMSHYITNGLNEGRATNTFDPSRYLCSNGDLISAFGTDTTSASVHYIQNGRNEGRSTTAFDPLRYIASNGDLIGAFGTNTAAAMTHYLQNGYREGRSTSGFNPTSYLSANSDLSRAFGTDTNQALLHYINNGYREGRLTAPSPTTTRASDVAQGLYGSGNLASALA